MAIPVAVRRLIDGGIDPVVVAKHLLIGDRDGGSAYQISARAQSLAPHERVAESTLALVWRDVDALTAATMAATGATWIATQYKVDREMLCALVTNAHVRPRRYDRYGYGAVDLVDHDGVGTRALLVECVRQAQLPIFAPLEGRR